MAIQESGEDYLETILILRERNGVVRSIDIANELGYSKPSVSRAMSILKREGHIEIDESNHITLTQSGMAIAEKIYERHNLLARFFALCCAENRPVCGLQRKNRVSTRTRRFSRRQQFLSALSTQKYN